MGASSGGGRGVSRVGGVFAEDVTEGVERSGGDSISSSGKSWTLMAVIRHRRVVDIVLWGKLQP